MYIIRIQQRSFTPDIITFDEYTLIEDATEDALDRDCVPYDEATDADLQFTAYTQDLLLDCYD